MTRQHTERTNCALFYYLGLSFSSAPESPFLSRFFMVFLSPQEVWPQISGRDLEDWEEKSWRSLPEICGQTKGDLQTTEIQRITKAMQKHLFCQKFLPIFILSAIRRRIKKKTNRS